MDFLSEFRERLVNDEKAKLTVEKYVRDCRAFLAWISESGRTLDKEAVLCYKELISKKHKTAGANSILSSLNAYFSYIGRDELKVKILKRQMTTFRNEEKELTRDEYARLLNAAKERKNRKLYYIMMTVCRTGIRISELSYITVEAARKKEAVIGNKGKIRIILLPEKLCRELLCYASEEKIKSGPLFVTKNGNPLDRSNIWKMMKSLCESANVEKEKVFPHNLRHLFAVTFYSVHKDIVHLADILGHSTVSTTRIYTLQSSGAHSKQMEQLTGLLI